MAIGKTHPALSYDRPIRLTSEFRPKNGKIFEFRTVHFFQIETIFDPVMDTLSIHELEDRKSVSF